MKKLNLRMLILSALFAALTAVGAFIKLPIPFIPMTLQTLFVVSSGILLGGRYGALSQLLYVGIGLLGLPVFTQGGGFGYVFKPSFGYLIAFTAGAALTGWLYGKLQNKTVLRTFLCCLCGLVPIYGIGLPYMYIILNVYMDLGKSIGYVLMTGFVNVIISDIISCYVVALVSKKLTFALRKGA